MSIASSMVAKTISTFDDWIRDFENWQSDIGFPKQLLGDFRFETKFGDLGAASVEFGDFKDQKKWETSMQIPLQD
ncbi:MAG TPA: hypothetical protein VI565_09115, partial [Burkholderiales bacterium]|nr:hypothetical protein [Burkholderiales bacterium]